MAAVLGGYLYQTHPIIPYSIQGVLMLLATILSIGLMEIHVHPEKPITLRDQSRDVFSIIKKQSTTILIIILLTTSLATYEIFNNLTNQSYWREAGISVTYFGYIGLAIFIIRAILVRITPWIARYSQSYAWIVIGFITVSLGVGFLFSRSIIAVVLIS